MSSYVYSQHAKPFSASTRMRNLFEHMQSAHEKESWKTKLHSTAVEANISRMENKLSGKDVVVFRWPTLSAT